MGNPASFVCYSFFVGTLFYTCFAVSSLYFQGKPVGAVSAFITRNYPRRPAAASLFVSSVGLFLLMIVKCDVNKDVSFA